jgi:hypothetical protein
MVSRTARTPPDIVRKCPMRPVLAERGSRTGPDKSNRLVRSVRPSRLSVMRVAPLKSSPLTDLYPNEA